MRKRNILLRALKRLLKPVLGGIFKQIEMDLYYRFERYLYTISSAAQFVVFNQVEGDYLEFGIKKGKSFTQAYLDMIRFRYYLPKWVPYLKKDIRFFAFDSFQGLPKPSGLDATAKTPQHWVEGGGSLGGSERSFIDALKKENVDLSQVIVVKGLFQDTLTDELKAKHHLRKTCLVHIDCDYYESTVPVLNFITDLLAEGTVIVFDDWFRYKNNPNFGEQRACKEWLKRNPQIRLTELAKHRSHSIAFIVNLSNC